MEINLESLSAYSVEPTAAAIDEPSILNSITNELSTGLTYITVARIAYDMGQMERSRNAYRLAAEAEAEAHRLAGLLRESARATALRQLEGYKLVLEDSQDEKFQFPPSIRQPSLN
jgi:hypothetical protein